LLGIRLGRLHQYSPQSLSIKQLDLPARPTTELPLISMVTPSLNQVQFIKHTLDSVVSQKYPNMQYVVQDAKSSDGTSVVLERYSPKDVDIRIEADSGQADALNRGFAGTTGEVMGYLNSDDVLLPGTLHLVGRYFQDNPSVDVIYGNRLIIDEGGMEIGRWILPGHDAQVLRFIDYIPQESMFWRRRIWDRVGAKFDANLHFAMDWDLILRFLDAGALFHHVPGLFSVFRVHGAQKSQANFVTRGAGEIAGLRTRHRDDNTSRLTRAVLHVRYLYEHRKADSAFRASLVKRNWK
jgi:glycosyltransferase involved in cell wall biosynthesis